MSVVADDVGVPVVDVPVAAEDLGDLVRAYNT